MADKEQFHGRLKSIIDNAEWKVILMVVGVGGVGDWRDGDGGKNGRAKPMSRIRYGGRKKVPIEFSIVQ